MTDVFTNPGLVAAVDRLGRAVAAVAPEDFPERITDDEATWLGLCYVGTRAIGTLPSQLGVLMVDGMTLALDKERVSNERSDAR